MSLAPRTDAYRLMVECATDGWLEPGDPVILLPDGRVRKQRPRGKEPVIGTVVVFHWPTTGKLRADIVIDPGYAGYFPIDPQDHATRSKLWFALTPDDHVDHVDHVDNVDNDATS